MVGAAVPSAPPPVKAGLDPAIWPAAPTAAAKPAGVAGFPFCSYATTT